MAPPANSSNRSPQKAATSRLPPTTPSGPTAGRLYLAHGIEFGEGTKVVERLNENGGPVSFEGTAPYIRGNKLTGTPAGPFKNPSSVAVGPAGEIFVAEAGEKVDEFEPSGVFLREVTGSDAPGGGFSPGSIAVDPTTGDLLATTGKRDRGVFADRQLPRPDHGCRNACRLIFESEAVSQLTLADSSMPQTPIGSTFSVPVSLSQR